MYFDKNRKEEDDICPIYLGKKIIVTLANSHIPV